MKIEKRMIKENLKRILKHGRKEKNLNQAQIAKIMNMSQSNYSKIERGILTPSAVEWVMFCMATDTDLEELVRE